MKAVIALCIILAIGSVHCGVVPATTLVRTPSFDSAIIQSDRLGGNFAYSTVEGHAYAAVSPVVQRITEPVGVSYTAHQVNLGYAAAPVAVSQPIIAHQSIVAQPIISHQHFFAPPVASIVAQAPIFSGIASAPAVQAPAAAAPAPVEGTVVDSDTVAVESA